nr:MAG TPA: hypothetical protein [Caudoviricetes sp.]
MRVSRRKIEVDGFCLPQLTRRNKTGRRNNLTTL